ncbi:MAG: hypothetical protein ISS72_06305 [Candidatus Brocadiae bacterium]|nr:hypothetical protein [Candidatus Brocadiia bacterium]
MRKGLMSIVLAMGLCAAAPAGTGRVVGKLTPAGRAVRVGAVERVPPTIMKLLDKTHWGRLDEARGSYVVDNLKPGTYDLAVETKAGRIEGVVLRVRGEAGQAVYDLEPATGAIATQRFDIEQYLEEGQAVSDEERAKIIRTKLRVDKLIDRVTKLTKVSRFIDKVRPLWVHGTRQRAVVLVELTRDRAFYASKGGEAIWRVETWPFVWMSDVWHKPRKGLRVWQRLRLQGDAWSRLGYVFDPRLGGVEVVAGKDTTLDVAVPATLPAGLGKVPAK